MFLAGLAAGVQNTTGCSRGEIAGGGAISSVFGIKWFFLLKAVRLLILGTILGGQCDNCGFCFSISTSFFFC